MTDFRNILASVNDLFSVPFCESFPSCVISAGRRLSAAGQPDDLTQHVLTLMSFFMPPDAGPREHHIVGVVGLDSRRMVRFNAPV